MHLTSYLSVNSTVTDVEKLISEFDIFNCMRPAYFQIIPQKIFSAANVLSSDDPLLQNLLS